MYFTYNGAITGGHNVMGVQAPRQSWLFAEGYTGAGFDEYLTLLNPNSEPRSGDDHLLPGRRRARSSSS